MSISGIVSIVHNLSDKVFRATVTWLMDNVKNTGINLSSIPYNNVNNNVTSGMLT